MANDNTIPQSDLDKINQAARDSGHKRFPAATSSDAKTGYGYRMEHGLGFEYGAIFGHNFRNAEVRELKKENELLEAREVAWNNKVLKLESDLADVKVEKLALKKLLIDQLYSIWKGCDTDLSFDEWRELFIANNNIL